MTPDPQGGAPQAEGSEQAKVTKDGSPRERMLDAVGHASMPAGSACCGQPRGCTMTHRGCLYLADPWKRAVLFGDKTVRCQADSPISGQCVLLNGHSGGHQTEARP